MRILIGSNGGLTGVYLSKQYRKLSKDLNEDVFLVGTDASFSNTGKFFVDKQLVLPPASKKEFIPELIDILNKEEIDIYIPTHSKEIKIVSKNEDIIKNNTNSKFIVSPFCTFEALDDKRVANSNLKKEGFPVPKLIEDYTCNYPILMKDDIGSGGSSNIRIDCFDVHQAYKKSRSSCSFYELLRGEEYTVDCMFDSSGSLIAFNQRERLKTIGGAVSISKNSNKIDIEPWLHKFEEKWIFKGCVNFQFIYADGKPYFIDINLRYPSGGLPLSVESGLAVPSLILDLLSNKNRKKESKINCYKELSMYRYFEEIFE